jgi:hypothetical protein
MPLVLAELPDVVPQVVRHLETVERVFGGVQAAEVRDLTRRTA